MKEITPTTQAPAIFRRLLIALETGRPLPFGPDEITLIECHGRPGMEAKRYYFLARKDRKAQNTWTTYGSTYYGDIVRRFREIYYEVKYNFRP